MNPRTQILQGLVDLRNRIPQVDLGDMTQDPAIRFAGTRDAVRRMAGMPTERLALPRDPWEQRGTYGGIHRSDIDDFHDAAYLQRNGWAWHNGSEFIEDERAKAIEALVNNPSADLDEEGLEALMDRYSLRDFAAYDKLSPWDRDIVDMDLFDALSEDVFNKYTNRELQIIKTPLLQDPYIRDFGILKPKSKYYEPDYEYHPSDFEYDVELMQDFLTNQVEVDGSILDLGSQALDDVSAAVPNASFDLIEGLEMLPSSRRPEVLDALRRMGIQSDKGRFTYNDLAELATGRFGLDEGDLPVFGRMIRQDTQDRSLEELLSMYNRIYRKRRP
jgi:hypothetical protein